MMSETLTARSPGSARRAAVRGRPRGRAAARRPVSGAAPRRRRTAPRPTAPAPRARAPAREPRPQAPEPSATGPAGAAAHDRLHVEPVQLEIVHLAAAPAVRVDELVVEDAEAEVDAAHPCPMFVISISGIAASATRTITPR